MARTIGRVTIVVPTFRRPGYVETCLTNLERLERRPDQVVVVDASPDGETAQVVARHAGVEYVHSPLGAGTLPESRQLGLARAVGEVVAFVDDDVRVEPSWLDELLRAYDDDSVVGAGGRVIHDGKPVLPPQDVEIGRLNGNGTLVGNFDADPGAPIDVDHLIGANMSYRRAALLEVGGIHGGYPGPCVCEDTDIALRQRARGGRIVFVPTAVVHHAAAPYAIRGDRFDRRWYYYSRRNHAAMLVRIYGGGAPVTRRYCATVLHDEVARVPYGIAALLGRHPDPAHPHPRLRGASQFARAVVGCSGAVVGLVAGLRLARREGRVRASAAVPSRR